MRIKWPIYFAKKVFRHFCFRSQGAGNQDARYIDMLRIKWKMAHYLQLKSRKDKNPAIDKGHVEPIDDPKP
jgi:hypothetical protein